MKLYFAGNSGAWPIKTLIENSEVRKILISYHYVLDSPAHYIDKGLEYLNGHNSRQDPEDPQEII